MSETPYAPPKATVADPAESPRRPAVIWVTQVLALLVAALALYSDIRWLLGNISVAPVLLVRLALQTLLGALAIVAFVGLIKPARWARLPSVIFALCISGLVYLGSYNDAQVLLRSPGERLIPGMVGMVLVLAFVLYPLRLCFGKAARSFFETAAPRSEAKLN
jgi:hypothetical protein